MADKVVSPKNRINLIGVELEGAWDKAPAVLIVRDGSVKFDPPYKYIGEAVSQTFKPDTDDMANWVTAVYPNHVNETCGLHVHMSFKYIINYMRLMTPRFTDEIVKRIAEWAEDEKLPIKHPIWKRVMDKNHQHCAHQYCGDHQIHSKTKDWHSRGQPHSRYTVLNYCFSLENRKTVECRLLPMMETPDQAIRGINRICLVTNQFLAKMKDREPRVASQVLRSCMTRTKYKSVI
jgi:hypothetical protein